MTGFDLIFLLCFLASVVTLATLGVQSLRRRPTARLRKRLLVGWLGYGLTLLGVSLFTPARSVDRGSPQCSDDWCLTLVGVTNAARADGREYTLQLNLTNRGHGRPQRERFVSVYVVQADGRRVDAVADTDAVPFDTLVVASQSVRAVRRFQLPAGQLPVSMVVAREGLGRFPRCCIIGDADSFWHKPTFVRLESH